MFKVTNKLESYNLINRLGLNKLPEIYVEKFDENKVMEFLRQYPSDFYAVRDRNKSGSKYFKLFVKRDEILDYVRGRDRFSINISGPSVANHQLLTGEIKLALNGDFSLTASKDKQASARSAVDKPDYNFTSNISEHKNRLIPGFDYLIDYLFEHELFDAIIEFAVFDTNLGTKGEKVVVFEIRTDY